MADLGDLQLLAEGHFRYNHHLKLFQCLFSQIIFQDMDRDVLVEFGKSRLRNFGTFLSNFVFSYVELPDSALEDKYAQQFGLTYLSGQVSNGSRCFVV